jgi:hypothetical protein
MTGCPRFKRRKKKEEISASFRHHLVPIPAIFFFCTEQAKLVILSAVGAKDLLFLLFNEPASLSSLRYAQGRP